MKNKEQILKLIDVLQSVHDCLNEKSSSYCEDADCPCDCTCPAYNLKSDHCIVLELLDSIQTLKAFIEED